ncbi:uncharacterized protein LOC143051344 [Mytilus galloprovincialis]|uniref:uncharacterized protein LOC143051344 n=1 Tax=Mytilus galloprovincialis TaxID=29158 RepID=UPI003F7C0249
MNYHSIFILVFHFFIPLHCSVVFQDITDETICTSCPSGYFQCKNCRCIPSSWRCDGDKDCGLDDTSDEDNRHLCGQCSGFRCECGRCIPQRWLCDGVPDCSDNSDEIQCEGKDYCDLDPDNHFRCTASGRCIILKWKCDGEFDCGAGDQSDEEGCSNS